MKDCHGTPIFDCTDKQGVCSVNACIDACPVQTGNTEDKLLAQDT